MENINNIDREDLNSPDQSNLKWFISLDSYQQDKRSFTVLAEHCLCNKCSDELKKGDEQPSFDDFLSTIKDCCSKTPGFINQKQPIMESVFRIFLSNDNQPLNLEELGTQLREFRSGDTYRTSPEILQRLLNTDRYYGIRQVPQV